MNSNIALLLASMLLIGCAATKDRIVVGTSTVLGFEIAQNPGTGMYQARLGYGRAEIAVTPTNNVDVITEIRWNSLLQTGGLYQRMAIGKTACENSVYMFLKDRNGDVNPQALTAAHQLYMLRNSTNK